MARKAQAKTQKQRTLSQAELDAAVARTAMWTSVMKILLYVFCLPVSILALYPVTTLIAGEETVVDVNIVITLSLAITMTVSAAGAGAWGIQRNRAARDARREIAKLRSKLLEAETTLSASAKRVQELEEDLSGVRNDLERIRKT
jgi:hypothetical protein